MQNRRGNKSWCGVEEILNYLAVESESSVSSFCSRELNQNRIYQQTHFEIQVVIFPLIMLKEHTRVKIAAEQRPISNPPAVIDQQKCITDVGNKVVAPVKNPKTWTNICIMSFGKFDGSNKFFFILNIMSLIASNLIFRFSLQNSSNLSNKSPSDQTHFVPVLHTNLLKRLVNQG